MDNIVLKNPARPDGKYRVFIYVDATGQEKLRVCSDQGIPVKNIKFSKDERARFTPGTEFFLTLVEPKRGDFYFSTEQSLTPVSEMKEEKKSNRLGKAFIENDKLSLLLACVKLGKYPFLIGPKGCGKSTIASELAKEWDANFFPFDMGQALKPKKFFIGGMSLIDNKTIQVRSEFFKAYTDPEARNIIFLDEITRIPDMAANFLMTILSPNDSYIYDEDSGLRFYKGKNVRIIAAGNMGSQYVSTTSLDSAFEDRFIKVELKHLMPDMEVELLLERCPKISSSNARTLVKAANILRTANLKGELQQTCSTRTLLNAADLMQEGFDLKFVMENVIITNYISHDEVPVAKALLSSL